MKLPSGSNIPKWAKYATITAHMQNGKVLRKLSVQTFSAVGCLNLKNELSAHYGLPGRQDTLSHPVPNAFWRTKKMLINLDCKDVCKVDFTALARKRLE